MYLPDDVVIDHTNELLKLVLVTALFGGILSTGTPLVAACSKIRSAMTRGKIAMYCNETARYWLLHCQADPHFSMGAVAFLQSHGMSCKHHGRLQVRQHLSMHRPPTRMLLCLLTRAIDTTCTCSPIRNRLDHTKQHHQQSSKHCSLSVFPFVFALSGRACSEGLYRSAASSMTQRLHCCKGGVGTRFGCVDWEAQVSLHRRLL